MPQMDRGPMDGASITSIDGHFELFPKGLFWQVYELIDEYEARKEQSSSMDTWSVDRCLICDGSVLPHISI